MNRHESVQAEVPAGPLIASQLQDRPILSLIRARYNTFSESQKRVADHVLKNADEVMLTTISDLADACQVSETTILRFLRKLGYTSYQVFRVKIAQEVSQGSAENIYGEVTAEDSIAEVVNKVIHSTSQAIVDSTQIISINQLEKAIDLLHGARNIFVIGIGASASMAFDLHHKLVKLGLGSSFSHDAHMINIQSSNMEAQDVVVVFSHSGESRETLDGATNARKNGCPIVAITSYPHSKLAILATSVILSSSQETRYRSDALTSRMIQLTIIDIIYLLLALRMGERAKVNINRSRIAVARNKT